MDSPINPFDPAAVAGTGFRPVSVPPPGTERLVHAVAAAADPHKINAHCAHGSYLVVDPDGSHAHCTKCGVEFRNRDGMWERVDAPAPAPAHASEAWLRQAADFEDRHGPIRVGVPSPDPIPLDDPRWTTPVRVPTPSVLDARAALGGRTLHETVNPRTYALPGGGHALKPIDALNAFEGALTLVLVTGQLAAEAMWQAGIPRAEIDDRITRFTAALHQASTSASPVFSVKPPSHAASERFDPASGHKPEAAVSSSSGAAGAVTFPAPAVSAN